MTKTVFDEFIASHSPDFYRKGINELISRWKKCIEVDGDHFGYFIEKVKVCDTNFPYEKTKRQTFYL
jgi:hypothetical protein